MADRKNFVVNNECNNFKVGAEFLKKYKWPKILCNPKYDRCYCKLCYAADMPDNYEAGGKMYVMPRGWTRFGVHMDTVIAKHHQIWDKWAHCYHGTSIESARSIIEHRQMLLPGERKLDGNIISIRPGHIPGQNEFFTTPTIKYAEHAAYASRYTFTSSNKRQYNIKVVLQCKQKPDSFIVQPETVAATKKICNFIPNSKMEWKTKVRSSIMPYGLLLLIEPIRSSSIEDVMSRRVGPWNYIEINPESRMAIGVSLRIDCPHCYHPNVFKDPENNQGMVITCESRHCNVVFRAYNCPYCSHLHSICKCRRRFSEESDVECWNENCRETILNRKCIQCSAFNFCKQPKDFQAVSLKCCNKTCKKSFQVYNCPHCQQEYHHEGAIPKEGYTISCSKKACNKYFQLVNCPLCCNVNVCPNVYGKAGPDSVTKCAYNGCNMKFQQPIKPSLVCVGRR